MKQIHWHASRTFDFYKLEERVLLNAAGLNADFDEANADSDGDSQQTVAAFDASRIPIPDRLDSAESLTDPIDKIRTSEVMPDEQADVQDRQDDLVEEISLQKSVHGSRLPEVGSRLEILFVDQQVHDAQTLLEGLRSDTSEPTRWRIVQIDRSEDGIAKISSVLKDSQGVDAIHLLSHGDGKGIQLGNSRLDLTTASELTNEISSWSDALSPDADLLVYGCDLASTEDGRLLLELLETSCGCDIAASDDLTGHQSLDADWDLEYSLGDLETKLAFSSASQAAWRGTLANEAPSIQQGSGFTDSGQLNSPGDTWAVTLGDIDGDGDLDLITGDMTLSKPNRVFINDGNGLFTDTGQAIGTQETRAVVLADIDGDGDQDLLVANHFRVNKVYINDGSGGFSDSGQILGSNGTSLSIAAGDIDGDNDIDMVVANHNQPNKVYLNNGSGVFSDSGQALGGSGWSQDIALGDVDGDTDLDIIVANEANEANKIYLNNGSGNFTDSGQALGNQNTGDIHLGDVDGDGDLDIVAGNKGQPNVLYINNGIGVFGNSGQFSGPTQTESIAMADVDGDSDLDIVTGNVSQGNRVHINDGSGNFTDSGQSLGTANTRALVLGDIDGDHDIDIVTGVHGDGDRIYLNDSSLISFTPLSLNEGDPATLLTSGASVNDSDNTNLGTGNLTIAYSVAGDNGDRISIQNQGLGTGQIGFDGTNVRYEGTIIGSLNTVQNGVAGANFSVDFNSNATLDSVSALMNNITFENTSSSPAPVRTLSITVNDGNGGTSDVVSQVINIASSNAAPSETSIENIPLDYTENDGPVAITNTLVIGDTDDTHLESASIRIHNNYVNGEDVLSFINTPSINGSWNASTGTLTLTGSDTLSNYTAALRSITYENLSNNPSTLIRTVSFNVHDGDDNSNTVTRDIGLTALNDAAVVSNIESSKLSYTEGNGPLAITDDIAIADVDDTHIESASIEIINFINSEDTLSFSNTGTIVGSWNSTTGVLTLSGQDTLTNYESALQSITYQNSSNNPIRVDRSIHFSVNDGDTDSATLSRDIQIASVNDAPIQATIESTHLTYTENNGPVAITSTFSVTDADDTHLESARIRIIGNHVNGEDILAFSNIGSISGSWNANTGTLTLTGSDTLASYTTALRTVTYENISENPVSLVRTVEITVNDGDGDSNSLTRGIDVIPVNDVPQVHNAGITVNEGEIGAVLTRSMLESRDPDDDPSVLTYTLTSNVNHGDLRLNGIVLVANDIFTQADINAGRVVYDHDNSEAFADSFGFTVIDSGGPGVGISGTFNISVTPINDHAASSLVDNDPRSDFISENAASGTSVGLTLFSEDLDASDTIRYSLDDNDGGRFAIDPNTGIVTVAGNIDRESDGPNRSIVARATSSDGSFQRTGFTIAITDVDEFDVSAIIDSDPSTNTVAENSGNGSTVGIRAFAVDPDSTSNTVTYSLSKNADGRFAIDSSTGLVTVARGAALDHEIDAFHDIEVVATSDDGSLQTAFFRVFIADINETPVITANTGVVVQEGDVVSFSTSMLRAEDPDDHGAGLTYTVIANPNGGHLELATNPGTVVSQFTQQDIDNGQLVYQHAGGETPSDSFSFSLADGGEDGVGPILGTFSFTVLPVNDAPTGSSTTIHLNEDQTHVSQVADFGFNDVDGNTFQSVRIGTISDRGFLRHNGLIVAEGDSITVASIQAGNLTFTPEDNAFGGNYAFATFFVQDDGGTTRGGQDTDLTERVMTWNVLPVNDAPIAIGDHYSVSVSNTLAVSTPGLLENDSDIDGDRLSALLVHGPADGTILMNLDGSFSYTPRAGFIGTDTFVYAVNDGTVTSHSVEVSIEVVNALTAHGNGTSTASGAENQETENLTKSIPSPNALKPISFERFDFETKLTDGAGKALVVNAVEAFEFRNISKVDLGTETDDSESIRVGSPSLSRNHAVRLTEILPSIDVADQLLLEDINHIFEWTDSQSFSNTLEADLDSEHMTTGVAVFASGFATVGYAVSTLRSVFFVLTATFSGAPAMRQFDPLIVLNAYRDYQADRNGEDDLCSIF